MILNDTIVACATPVGYSSIGVVRLNGPQAIPLAKRIFIPRQKTDEFESNRAYFGEIINPQNNDVIDAVIAIFYLTPHSYTGEDVVEFSSHGNPLIVNQIIKILTNLGARLAQRGEFTKRALLNGKIDLLQAEAVLDTIYASCDEARKLAIRQYEGKLSEKIYTLRARIVDLLSVVEAYIDFPEEEDVQNTHVNIAQELKSMVEELDELLKGSVVGLKIKQGYQVLIMGRVNVGKSTLFNTILGYERAITHEEPCTTRDYIEESVHIAGMHVRLFDTAGVLNRLSGPDKIAQERAIQLIEKADLVLLMFDGSDSMNEEDLYLHNLTNEKKRVLIVNKIDLNLQLNDNKILSDSIKLSAKTGKNIGLLLNAVKDSLKPQEGFQDVLLTRKRHISAIENTKEYLIRGENAPSPETLAFELHSALDVIGELTGKVMRREILDKIFEEFCVGK